MMLVCVQEIATMERSALLALWAEMLGGAPPKRMSAPLLRRILAFELQARRQGRLCRAYERRLTRMALGQARRATPGIRPGGRLIREWNGVTHVVDVTDDGYLWRDDRYRSLSAVARAITGAHWSGPRFFGLARPVEQ